MKKMLLGTAGVLALCPGLAVAQNGTQAQPTPAGQTQSGGGSENGGAQAAPVAGSTSPTASPAAAAAATPSGQLGDIIVTAPRREENLQRAAVAVDVVTGADLISSGTTNASRLTELAPALVVEPSSTGNLIFLRGVGNFTVVPTSDPAVAFNYDGVYVGRPTSTTGSFFDLARIEVLKGPQGTLYGRNATGGAINVIPEHPRAGENSGYATASYGNYNAATVEGAINLALGDKGALRVSGTLVRRDGYLRDGTSDDRTEGVRVQMMGKLTDRLTVRVAGDYSHNGGVGNSISYLGVYAINPALGRFVFTPANIPTDQGVYTAASQAFRTTTSAGPAGRRLDALAPYPFQNNNYYGTNAEVNWSTGIGTVTFIPAWRYSSLNYLATAGAFPYRQREKDEQYSGELRLAGNRIGFLDYTLGAFYYHESEKFRTVLSLASQESFGDNRLTTSSYAPFARLTAHLSDRLRVVGGVRYTHDHKTFVNSGIAGTIACNARVNGVPTCPNAPLFPLVDTPSQLPFAFPTAGGPPVVFPGTGAVLVRGDSAYNTQLTNERVTYRGAVEFDIAARSLLYASVETGFRSGGFAASVGHETYDPETITAYTVGLKNRLLDNKLQLNLEGFLWNYRNQQVNHVGLDNAGRTSNFTESIGSSRIYGAEVEAQVLVTPTTLLSADAQYLHTENLSFVYTSGAANGPPLTGCPYAIAPNNAALYAINCTGFPANNAPRWTVNLAGQQTIPLGTYQAVLGANTQYRSGRYIGFAYLPEQYTGPSWQTNAQASFGPADGRWSVAVFVRNIEGNRIPIFTGTHALANLLVVGTTAPRTFGGRASVKF